MSRKMSQLTLEEFGEATKRLKEVMTEAVRSEISDGTFILMVFGPIEEESNWSCLYSNLPLPYLKQALFSMAAQSTHADFGEFGRKEGL